MNRRNFPLFDRWSQDESTKICGLDIDGVLNLYPDPWVDYLNKQLGENFQDLNEAKEQVSYTAYKDLKWAYRESGIKATLEVRPGAKEVLERLKSMEYDILILTSRPFAQHPCLFKQTVDWLALRELPYDGIIFGDDKYVKVLTQVPNLRFLVDDHRYHAMQVARWGYNSFLVDNIYNQGDLDPKVHRIETLEEIFDYDFVSKDQRGR